MVEPDGVARVRDVLEERPVVERRVHVARDEAIHVVDDGWPQRPPSLVPVDAALVLNGHARYL